MKKQAASLVVYLQSKRKEQPVSKYSFYTWGGGSESYHKVPSLINKIILKWTHTGVQKHFYYSLKKAQAGKL